MGDAPDVKVVDLAKRCDPAISELIKNMENALPGHKRVFQKLPNHLRRRAMSYDIKKVPRKMRPAVQEQVEGAAEAKARNKPPGRHQNHFRIHGRELCLHRNEKNNWLETHLWHAKRFHIKDLWGWKIPYSPTMKGTRSMIKQTSETCTIRDISYYSVIDIIGQPELINARLTTMITPNSYLEQSLRVLFEVDLFQPEKYPNEAIGPVHIYRISADHIWCICHPLLSQQIISAFEGFQVRDFEREINVFELFGPKSTENIINALPPNDSNNALLINTVYSLKGPGTVPPGFSIAYVSSDPRTIPSDYKHPTAGEPFDIFSGINLELTESSLYKGCSELSIPHDQEFNEARSKLLFPSAEGPSGKLSVLLMQKFATTKFGSSWLLFVPFGAGAASFKSLIKQGSRAIGLEEADLIELESQKFAFPKGRPETHKGFEDWTREMNEITAENNAKPPSKRIHLDFFTFPENFFISNTHDDNSFARVEINCVRRGTPSRFAVLFMPNDDDLKSCGEICEITAKNSQRKPIGVVSDGRNSLLAGTGRGIGFVSFNEFENLPAANSLENCKHKGDAKLAMMKEQGSQYFHHVWLQLM